MGLKVGDVVSLTGRRWSVSGSQTGVITGKLGRDNRYSLKRDYNDGVTVGHLVGSAKAGDPWEIELLEEESWD